MRLLVTGASGLLGINLALEAFDSHTVIGIDRGTLFSPPFELIRMDLTDPGAIEKALDRSRADAVVHCAAVADVDACERDPEMARRVNTELPRQIAASCARRGVRLVHISTDAVFDGSKTGAYTEGDEPRPLGVYAETKLAAEAAVLRAHPQALVVRVNFYGWSVSGNRSLAEFFVNSLRVGQPVKGFTDVIFCPMLVNDLAGLLLKLLDGDLHGLFHAVGPLPMTKHDFGVKIARRFGFDENVVSTASVKEAALAARRAPNLNLSVHRLSTALGELPPSFSTGLDRFYSLYTQGYPQKLRSYQQEAPIHGPQIWMGGQRMPEEPR